MVPTFERIDEYQNFSIFISIMKVIKKIIIIVIVNFGWLFGQFGRDYEID